MTSLAASWGGTALCEQKILLNQGVRSTKRARGLRLDRRLPGPLAAAALLILPARSAIALWLVPARSAGARGRQAAAAARVSRMRPLGVSSTRPSGRTGHNAPPPHPLNTLASLMPYTMRWPAAPTRSAAALAEPLPPPCRWLGARRRSVGLPVESGSRRSPRGGEGASGRTRRRLRASAGARRSRRPARGPASWTSEASPVCLDHMLGRQQPAQLLAVGVAVHGREQRPDRLDLAEHRGQQCWKSPACTSSRSRGRDARLASGGSLRRGEVRVGDGGDKHVRIKLAGHAPVAPNADERCPRGGRSREVRICRARQESPANPESFCLRALLNARINLARQGAGANWCQLMPIHEVPEAIVLAFISASRGRDRQRHLRIAQLLRAKTARSVTESGTVTLLPRLSRVGSERGAAAVRRAFASSRCARRSRAGSGCA